MNNWFANKKFFAICLFIFVGVVIFISTGKTATPSSKSNRVKSTLQQVLNPLTIKAMQQRQYPASQIILTQTLPDGSNYHQYIISYVSDGLTIYGLLTIPLSQKPANGFPAILFNHGYITPASYQTFPSVGQYATYVPPIARSGYVVFKVDYRGNGNSQGQPEGAYYSPAYATDVLNALSSLKQFKDPNGSGLLINSQKIGMWGHSMGGNITLRDIVVDSKDIKAAVIWGGVVGSYADLEHWHDPSYHPSSYELTLRYRYRASLEKQFGTPQSNPSFWDSIDPTYFLSNITTPIQLHVGLADEEVPPSFSEDLYQKLQTAHKTAELYTYPGANHNISQNFDIAMQRSIAFFDKYLK